jgi:hypothetical protein
MRGIAKIWNDLISGMVRFPTPILSACLAFVFFVIEMHLVQDGSYFQRNMIVVRILLEAVCGISLFTAFEFFHASHQLHFSKRFGIYLLGFCILGMHYFSILPVMFDSESVFLSRYLIFFLAYHLLISCITFYRVADIQAFWKYNYTLLVRFFIALSYSTILFAGLAGALWACDTLFHFQIKAIYYADLAAFIFLVFNTLVFFMGIPENFQVFASSIHFPKALRILAQYILVPILGIYTLILYFYLFQILINRNMPSDWVCLPILIYAIAGVVTFVLVYPIRNHPQYSSIRTFARYFFYILLPLLVLYFIGIVLRIKPYGLTEDRYLILVLGIWLLLIALYFILFAKENIIFIPLSLFILISISAIGPWGMFQLSVRNQHTRLERLLKKNQLVLNRKLVRKSDGGQMSDSDLSGIRTILRYLNKRGQLHLIKHWLDEKDQQLLESATNKEELFAVNAIFTGKDLQVDTTRQVTIELLSDSVSGRDFPLMTDSFSHVQQFIFSALQTDLNKGLNIVLQDSLIHFVMLNDTLDSYNLTPMMKKVIEAYHTKMALRWSEHDFHGFNLENHLLQQDIQSYHQMQAVGKRSRLYLNAFKFTYVNQHFVPLYLEGYLMFHSRSGKKS